MKEIQLTQGKVALVDDEDFERLDKFKWHYNAKGDARRNGPRGKGKREVILMHRIILDAPRGLEVDHINRDTLDNRKCNLRLCNRVENCRNKTKQSNNKSGYKGVSWHTDGKWQVQICISGQRLHLGRYDCKHEAARIYNKAAIEYHGEFACLNEIKGGL
jgi:hypothetical protein